MSVRMAVGAGLSGAILGPKFGGLVIQAGGLVTIGGWLLVIQQVHGAGTSQLGRLDSGPAARRPRDGPGRRATVRRGACLGHRRGDRLGVGAAQRRPAARRRHRRGCARHDLLLQRSATSSFHAAFDRTLWVEIGSLVVMVALSGLLPRYAREPATEADTTEPSNSHESTSVAVSTG